MSIDDLLSVNEVGFRTDVISVAMVNTVYRRGGAALMAATLAKALNESQDPVQATLFHCEDRDIVHGRHGLRRSGARQLNALLTRVLGSGATVDLGASREIIRLTTEADVLHVHNLHGYYLDYEQLLAEWRRRPVVWTWHDMWGATGRCAASQSCELWRSGCPKCPNKHFYPAAWVDRAARDFTRKHAAFRSLENLWVVAPSAWLGEIATQSGFAASRVKVIPNPVDQTYFQMMLTDDARIKLDLQDTRVLALFVARDCDDPNKGYDDFACAVASAGCLGVAVGMPPKNPAKHLIHRGSITDRVELSLYYNAADVLVVPSYGDNFPNTVIEALSCGTPVIGYATGGIPEQLDMPFCSAVRARDVTALIAALASVRGRSKEVATQLARHAFDRWSVDTVCEKYVDVYRVALAGGAA